MFMFNNLILPLFKQLIIKKQAQSTEIKKRETFSFYFAFQGQKEEKEEK